MRLIMLIVSICFVTMSFAKETSDFKSIPHYVWDSESSNIGPTEIWFQDWTDYIRLYIKSTNGSMLIEKHPYAKTDYETGYLNAKDLTKPTYIQLLGNIEWTDSQNWSEGNINKFEWMVDRDQNWTYKEKNLSGSARILEGKLHLRIKDYDKIIIDVISEYRKYK